MDGMEAMRAGFGPLLAQTARQWRRAVDRALEPFGLTEATWLPLIHLARAPVALRQKQLAAALLLDNSAVVRLLDLLEAQGLIERREEASDRRAKAILLTDAGREMVEMVEVAALRVREEALAGVSAEDMAVVMRVLAQVLDHFMPREAEPAAEGRA
ncbi:MarR family transcriptional regulator [Acetobacteraceae bacterium H6797]|nr:MarR family transcriptional regulator [Acetobacteraceae bacterium H6797]